MEESCLWESQKKKKRTRKLCHKLHPDNCSVVLHRTVSVWRGVSCREGKVGLEGAAGISQAPVSSRQLCLRAPQHCQVSTAACRSSQDSLNAPKVLVSESRGNLSSAFSRLGII